MPPLDNTLLCCLSTVRAKKKTFFCRYFLWLFLYFFANWKWFFLDNIKKDFQDHGKFSFDNFVCCLRKNGGKETFQSTWGKIWHVIDFAFERRSLWFVLLIRFEQSPKRNQSMLNLISFWDGLFWSPKLFDTEPFIKNETENFFPPTSHHFSFPKNPSKIHPSCISKSNLPRIADNTHIKSIIN